MISGHERNQDWNKKMPRIEWDENTAYPNWWGTKKTTLSGRFSVLSVYVQKKKISWDMEKQEWAKFKGFRRKEIIKMNEIETNTQKCKELMKWRDGSWKRLTVDNHYSNQPKLKREDSN